MTDESSLITRGSRPGAPTCDDGFMTGRRLLVLAWSACATAALTAVVLVSGAGRSLPDLGPPLDLDPPAAESSTPAAPSSTPARAPARAPAPAHSVKVQSRPPVRVPAPPPADDDDVTDDNDVTDDDDPGEEPDDGG